MSIENIHLLEKEIHQTFNWDADTINSFISQIDSLSALYPISKRQNFHMFTRLLREFNRKLNKFGFSDEIDHPIDAGFRPQDAVDFFLDYLKLEDSNFILSEDGFKITIDSENGLADVTNFGLAYYPQNIAVDESSSSNITRGDSDYLSISAAQFYTAGRILITNSLTLDKLSDITPSIATTDENGFITRHSEGIATFAFAQGGVTRQIEVNLNNKPTGGNTLEFVSANPSSLVSHISDQIDSLIDSSMTMATNGKLFSTQNHSTSTYVRNVDFWCNNGIDLTCISPWNSNSANRKAGTLITPRHIVNAAHYEYNVGTKIRFVSMNNVMHEYTIVGKKRHPDYQPYAPDLTVYTLDSDVDSSISPCKLFPADAFNYITAGNLNDTRPAALGLDQEEKGLIIDMASNKSFLTSVDSDRLIFNESKILGDSGNPAFVIINGELVLVTLWTFGGAGSGTAINENIAALNQMIIDSDAQSGANTGYTVTEFDLSAFPTF